MKINRMLLGIVFFPTLATSVLMPSAFAGDSFNVNVDLTKGEPSPIQFDNETEDSVWYELPDEEIYQLDVSNSSNVCPSNQCKFTSYTDKMIFIGSDNYMALAGKFDLIDDKSNGHFTPKKQKLIEQMYLAVFFTRSSWMS